MVDILEERRKSNNDFQWASRSWKSSGCFTKGETKDYRSIIRAVMTSKKLQAVVDEICEKENRRRAEVLDKAKEILDELSHNFQLYAVRWFGLILTKLSKKLYNSITVNIPRLEEIRQKYKNYPVVLLPTHRSYVDFLLVSYINFFFELPMPIVATGMDFMGMAGMAEVLRKSGAFFIRRKFGGDSLYWVIITEYLNTCILYGEHPFEMFIEGTRSRSGKSLPPKIGMLSVLAQLLQTGLVPDILILPISISYDRTLEEKLYALELLGKPKPKETTNGLLKAIRWLGAQNYGNIYVNFGDFMSLREYIQPPFASSELNVYINRFATEVVVQHQRNLTLPLISSVSTLILPRISRGDRCVPYAKLTRQVKQLQILLMSCQSGFGFPLKGKSLEENLFCICDIHSSVLTFCNDKVKHLLNFEVCCTDAAGMMQLQHYSNQLLPIILPFCLISLNPRSENIGDKVLTADAVENYIFLRKMFQDDFVYKKGHETKEAEWAFEILNLIQGSDPFQSETELLNGTNYHEFMETLAFSIEPYIISYLALLKASLLMYKEKSFEQLKDPKGVAKLVQSYLKAQFDTKKMPKQLGSLSLDTLANGVSSLANLGAFKRIKMDNGSYGVIVGDIEKLNFLQIRLVKLVERSILGSVLESSDLLKIDGEEAEEKTLVKSRL